MADDWFSFSPKAKPHTAKRRIHLSTKSKKKKADDPKSTGEQDEIKSTETESSVSSSEEKEITKKPIMTNSVQHIENNLQNWSKKQHLIYGNTASKPLNIPQTSKQDVFASARLLEMAHSSQQTVPVRLNPNKNTSKGFVTLCDQTNPPHSLPFGSQLPVTNTQLSRICTEADLAQNKPSEISLTQTKRISDQKDHSKEFDEPRWNISPISKPAKTLTVKEAILADFEVNSPEHPSPEQPEIHSPVLVLRKTNIQTYSRRTRNAKSSRTLFKEINEPRSSSCSSGTNEITDESDNEVLFHSCPDSRIAIPTSPPVDPNLSGCVLNNLLNLSFYYSQTQGELEDDQPKKQDKLSPSAVNEEIRKEILLNKSQATNRLESLSGDSASFYGFGESITLQENFDLRLSDFEDETHSPCNMAADDVIATKVSSLVEGHNLSSFLQDDDDLFAEIESPIKTIPNQIKVSPPKLAKEKCLNLPVHHPKLLTFENEHRTEPSRILNTNIFKDELFSVVPVPDFKINSMNGFSNGHGTKLSAPATKHRNIFEDEQLDDILSNCPINSKLPAHTVWTDPPSLNSFVGFSTGRGTKIVIDSAALAKSRTIFNGIDEEEPESIGQATLNQRSCTEQGKLVSNIFPNTEAPSCTKNIAESSVISRLSSAPAPLLQKCNGFTTGLGAPIQKPSSTKRKNIFEDFDMELHPVDDYSDNKPDQENINENANQEDFFKLDIKKSKNMFHEKDVGPTFVRPHLGGFSTGRGLAIAISEESIKRSIDIFNEDKFQDSKQPLSVDPLKKTTPINTSTPKAASAYSTCSESVVSSTDATFKRSRKLFEEDDVSKTPGNVSRSSTWTTPQPLHTPVNKPFPQSFTQEITASTKALLEDEMLGWENDHCAFNKEISKSRVSKAKPTRLFSQLETNEKETTSELSSKSTKDNLEVILKSTNIDSGVPPSVQSARKEALAAQQKAISEKCEIKQRPGALYLRKLVSNQIKWTDFVHNQTPRVNEPSDLLSDNVRNVNIENVKTFKFQISDKKSNADVITLSDEVKVVMDEQSEIGFAELSSAFLSIDSVDPKLLHTDWVSHHLSMIILKLAAMERAFPAIFAGQTLSPENVILQLKFRYDKEIDRAERSILRKVLEMDDVASRRMVLFVLKIWSDRECELSDGHYGVRTVLDAEMAKLVGVGKVAVGTKLMVQGGELIGLEEGCGPLEVPPTVRFKISANSTRRARWYTKLGLCRAPEPFTISLSSILADGGRIGSLAICILRVYTMLYVDKTRKAGSGTVLRSERVQKRFESNTVQELETIELLYSQVSREYDEEEETRRKTSVPKKQRISEVTDASQLFSILQHANDPEAVEEQLTSTQKKDLRSFQAKQIDLRADAINQRVREKLASNERTKLKVTQLLKLKVTDSRRPSTTAMLSIWSPHESLIDMLRENRFVQMCNASASGIRYNEIQLSAGRSTIFKPLPNGVYREDLQRTCTKISALGRPNFKPPFNELDTVGLVVKVGDFTKRKFQSVFLVDDSLNLMCVNFWAGLESFAYDDLVKVGRFLAVRDLQWRTINSNQTIPCTFATEFTFFTEHPKSTELANELEELRANIQDAERCIREALLKIETVSSVQKAKKSMPSPKTPLNRNHSTRGLPSTEVLKTPAEFSPGVGQPTALVQLRLEKLSTYGEAPPLSPLVLNDSIPLNRRLKRPRTQCTSADDLLNTSTTSVLRPNDTNVD